MTLNLAGVKFGSEGSPITLGSGKVRTQGVLFLDGSVSSGGSTPGDDDIILTGSFSVWSGGIGVMIYHDNHGDIKFNHEAGTIDVVNTGIGLLAVERVNQAQVPFGHASSITATLGESSIVKAGSFGIQTEIRPAGTGNISITHNGSIEAGKVGVHAVNGGTGSITVMTGTKSSIKSEGTDELDKTGGIHARVTGGTNKNTITIDHKGTISAKAEGIYASNRVSGSTSTSTITITTGEDPTPETPSITAGRQGIRLRHDGVGTFAITIHGTVMGHNAYTSGTTKYAGVHIEVKPGSSSEGEGGMIVVGPRAHVSSKSGEAIKVEDRVGDVKVILNEDSSGYVGHINGQILSSNAAATGTLTLYTRVGANEEEKQLKPGDIVYWRRAKMGVYDEVTQAKLSEITEGGTKKGYEFVEQTFFQLYQPRAKLYEVLPAVLLGLVEPISYSARMTTPRMVTGEEVVVAGLKGERMTIPEARSGVWVRLEASDGKREASTSSSAQGQLASISELSHASADNQRSNSRLKSRPLSWEVKQTGVALGLDVPTDDALMLGMNVHHRRVKTTVKDGGTAEATGIGIGLSLTHTNDDGLYVDGQLIYTRFFGITVSSESSGQIMSGGNGSGLTIGVEVGQQMTVANMTVTPRGGLSWSSVDMDDFVEPAAIDGNGTVAPEKGESVVGRVGVLTELGPADTDARMYASLDLEHEFSPELEVIASGVKLKTEVEPTWVRVGLGGSVPLGSTGTTILVGEAYYATAGSGNTEFGGGVTLDIRF